jgi:hypothetical protein
MMAPNGFEASWTARAEKIQLSKKLSKIPVKGTSRRLPRRAVLLLFSLFN